MWNEFKKTLIVEYDDVSRVAWDTRLLTVSEGIGYGMLMSVTYDDIVTFDKLWKFYCKYKNQHGLMHWKVTITSVVEENAATDSDEDCAMALILAYKKWKNEKYLFDAKELIKSIKTYEIEDYIIKPGDMWGGKKILNISYFAPAYYKVFGEVTNDSEFWNKVVDKCYEIIDKNQKLNNSVGLLVSDWCDSDGRKVEGMKYYFGYDATRTMWRIATDYLWFKDERAKVLCDRNNEWIKNGILNDIGDGYSLTGKKVNPNKNLTFISALSMTSILDNELKEHFTNLINNIKPKTYFDWCLGMLALSLLNNKFILL